MRLVDDEARHRFGSARVMTLGTVGPGGRPHLVPATFALLPGTDAADAPDTVVTAVDRKPKATTRLARLRHIAADPRVSLLVDRYDEDWTLLWWVRADGVAEVVDGPAAAEAIRVLAAKYPQYVAEPPAGPVIRVAVNRWQGWAAAAPAR